MSESPIESPKRTNETNAPKHTHPPSPWNAVTVTFNTLGIILGLAISVLGLTRAYKMIDSIWFEYLGEAKVTVLSQEKAPPSALKEYYYTTFKLPGSKKNSSVKVRIDHKALYEYIQQRTNPSSNRRVEAVLVRRMLSRRYYLAKVGSIRLAKTPKSAELMFYLGTMVLGAAVAFSALKDLRKRWLRRGIQI